MPVFFQQNIDEHTKLGIWHILEDESFFWQVPLQREITHPHKRLQHLAGRYLLHYLFVDFPIELIKIADTRKPFLENEAYHFSISHCGNYVAAIVSKEERVGLDVELPSHKVERIKNKFLSKEELKLAAEQPNEISEMNYKPQTANCKLTLFWCCKEAVYKWWSYGNVDFREKIRLQPFKLQPAGSLVATFFSNEKAIDVTVHYTLFEELCLAWVKTKPIIF